MSFFFDLDEPWFYDEQAERDFKAGHVNGDANGKHYIGIAYDDIQPRRPQGSELIVARSKLAKTDEIYYIPEIMLHEDEFCPCDLIGLPILIRHEQKGGSVGYIADAWVTDREIKDMRYQQGQVNAGFDKSNSKRLMVRLFIHREHVERIKQELEISDIKNSSLSVGYSFDVLPTDNPDNVKIGSKRIMEISLCNMGRYANCGIVLGASNDQKKGANNGGDTKILSKHIIKVTPNEKVGLAEVDQKLIKLTGQALIQAMSDPAPSNNANAPAETGKAPPTPSNTPPANNEPNKQAPPVDNSNKDVEDQGSNNDGATSPDNSEITPEFAQFCKENKLNPAIPGDLFKAMNLMSKGYGSLTSEYAKEYTAVADNVINMLKNDVNTGSKLDNKQVKNLKTFITKYENKEIAYGFKSLSEQISDLRKRLDEQTTKATDWEKKYNEVMKNNNNNKPANDTPTNDKKRPREEEPVEDADESKDDSIKQKNKKPRVTNSLQDSVKEAAEKFFKENPYAQSVKASFDKASEKFQKGNYIANQVLSNAKITTGAFTEGAIAKQLGIKIGGKGKN